MRNTSIKSVHHRSISETRFDEAIEAADALYQAFHTDLPRSAMIWHLYKLLSALPLAQNEYSFLCCRLGNADLYDREGERHAAAYEIGLLAKRLRAKLIRTVT